MDTASPWTHDTSASDPPVPGLQVCATTHILFPAFMIMRTVLVLRFLTLWWDPSNKISQLNSLCFQKDKVWFRVSWHMAFRANSSKQISTTLALKQVTCSRQVRWLTVSVLLRCPALTRWLPGFCNSDWKRPATASVLCMSGMRRFCFLGQSVELCCSLAAPSGWPCIL